MQKASIYRFSQTLRFFTRYIVSRLIDLSKSIFRKNLTLCTCLAIDRRRLCTYLVQNIHYGLELHPSHLIGVKFLGQARTIVYNLCTKNVTRLQNFVFRFPGPWGAWPKSKINLTNQQEQKVLELIYE